MGSLTWEQPDVVRLRSESARSVAWHKPAPRCSTRGINDSCGAQSNYCLLAKPALNGDNTEYARQLGT